MNFFTYLSLFSALTPLRCVIVYAILTARESEVSPPHDDRNEVSRLTGVSIRALHYYDQIGLLPATGHTDSGYRLYDDTALEHLQQILLFRNWNFR